MDRHCCLRILINNPRRFKIIFMLASQCSKRDSFVMIMLLTPIITLTTYSLRTQIWVSISSTSNVSNWFCWFYCSSAFKPITQRAEWAVEEASTPSEREVLKHIPLMLPRWSYLLAAFNFSRFILKDGFTWPTYGETLLWVTESQLLYHSMSPSTHKLIHCL